MFWLRLFKFLVIPPRFNILAGIVNSLFGGGGSSSTVKEHTQDRSTLYEGDSTIGDGSIGAVSGDNNNIKLTDHKSIAKAFDFGKLTFNKAIEATTEATQDAREGIATAHNNAMREQRKNIKTISNAFETAQVINNQATQQNRTLKYAVFGLVGVMALMAVTGAMKR